MCNSLQHILTSERYKTWITLKLFGGDTHIPCVTTKSCLFFFRKPSKIRYLCYCVQPKDKWFTLSCILCLCFGI